MSHKSQGWGLLNEVDFPIQSSWDNVASGVRKLFLETD